MLALAFRTHDGIRHCMDHCALTTKKIHGKYEMEKNLIKVR